MEQTAAEVNAKEAATKADGNAQGGGNTSGTTTNDEEGGWHKVGSKKRGGKDEGGDKHQRGGVQCRGQDGEGKVS